MTTTRQAGRKGGMARTAAKLAAGRANAAKARASKDALYVERAAAALVARYHALCREHDAVVAWEVAALSLAGTRRDIRARAREIVDAMNEACVNPPVMTPAVATLTFNVNRKAQG